MIALLCLLFDHLRRPQGDPKKNAFRSRPIMIEASGDLFPARSSLDHALEHVMWNNANQKDDN